MDHSALPVKVAAEIDNFDARDFLEKKERKRLNTMVYTMQLAIAAAAQASVEAKLREVPPDAARFGTVFGSSALPSVEQLGLAAFSVIGGHQGPFDLAGWGDLGLPYVPPMSLLNCIPNVTTGHVSIFNGALGPNNTITLSSAASLFALAEGFRIIGRDRADVMMIGGADTQLAPLSFAHHCLFGQLTRQTDNPERACRPFDRSRNGAVPGEGGVAYVLEEEENARKRGVPIWGEVLGCGASFDHARDGRGLVRAIRAALDQAEAQPGDIDHVNAHGLGTVDDDRLEAQAIREVFGTDRAPVFAAKSYLGNLGAAASLVELAVSLLAFQHGTLPCSLNHEEPDSECPIAVITQPRPIARPYVLKVSFTDLGQCVAAVIRCARA
jgi:3-oxoacyl-[acyl-carrier-protein] synthase II